MAIEIENIGANLKITVNGNARLVSKQSVNNIRIVEDCIKLSTDSGCCAPIEYLPYADITVPVAASIEAMRDLIGDMLVNAGASTPGAAGLATEVKQNEAIGKLNEIKTTVETGFTGKATELAQAQQTTAIQNVYTIIQSLITNVNNATATQATVSAQAGQSSILNSIDAQLSMVQLFLSNLVDEQLFLQAPLRTEQPSPEIRYEGYALPGTPDSMFQWAIRRRTELMPGHVVYEWAMGNRFRLHSWNQRTILPYQ